MNIDLTQIITAESKEESALLERAALIKSEVQSRIFAVVDQNTQASLLAAVVAGVMSEEDKLTFISGQTWIEATKIAGRKAVLDRGEPLWPTCPLDVIELANRY
jgi:hypothetical protein